MKNKYLPGTLFLLPALILFCIFSIYPILSAVSLSFYDAEIRYKEFIGFDNFKRLVKNEIFWKGVFNTLKYILFIVPPVVIFPFGVAVLSYKFKKGWQIFFRFAFYMPALAAGVIISIVWRWIFNPVSGIANQLLAMAGLDAIMWLGSTPWSMISICIVVITSGMGVNVLLYMASLASIPKEYYDAAKIDGCRPIQETLFITIPMMMPIIGFIFIKQAIGISQIFQNILILTNGGPYYASTSMVYQLYHHAFVSGKYGLAAAESMMLLLLVAVLSLGQARFFFRKR